MRAYFPMLLALLLLPGCVIATEGTDFGAEPRLPNWVETVPEVPGEWVCVATALPETDEDAEAQAAQARAFALWMLQTRVDALVVRAVGRPLPRTMTRIDGEAALVFTVRAQAPDGRVLRLTLAQVPVEALAATLGRTGVPAPSSGWSAAFATAQAAMPSPSPGLGAAGE